MSGSVLWGVQHDIIFFKLIKTVLLSIDGCDIEMETKNQISIY